MTRSIALTTLILSACLASAADRPNFLFIIANDQSPFDLKIYNLKENPTNSSTRTSRKIQITRPSAKNLRDYYSNR